MKELNLKEVQAKIVDIKAPLKKYIDQFGSAMMDAENCVCRWTIKKKI